MILKHWLNVDASSELDACMLRTKWCSMRESRYSFTNTSDTRTA